MSKIHLHLFIELKTFYTCATMEFYIMGYSIIFQKKFEHFYTQPLEKSQLTIL